MTDMEQHDQELDAFFKAARDTAPVPSDALIARILADAEEARPKSAAVAAPSVARPGFLSTLWSEIGGWRSVAGMGFAGLVGIFIGYSSPVLTDSGTTQLASDDYFYDMAGVSLTADDLWGEG